MSRPIGIRFASLAVAISLTAVATLTLSAAAMAKPAIPAPRALSSASAAAPAPAAAVAATDTMHAAAPGRTVSATSPMSTPSPVAEAIPLATSSYGDLVPGGVSWPAVIGLLAVASLMIGAYLIVSRGSGATTRTGGRRAAAGKRTKAPSARGPMGRAA
jgi:hypothetical protein